MAPQGLSSAAKQLASYGRGVDTELAHMSPDEMQFIDYMQGGRKENPYTGLPEYGWLGKLLKGIARVAGATVGYSIGGPLGAAAGSGLMTKATGGTWKQAAKGAAYSGLGSYAAQGLTGGGWGVTGSRMPYNVTAPDMDTAFGDGGADSFNIQKTSGLEGIRGAALSKAGLGAAYGALSQPLDNGGGGSSAPPPPPVDNFRLPTPKPLDRVYSPYQGDYSKYGQPGQNNEHSFFSQPPLSVIPQRTDQAAPAMYGDVQPGVQYLAEGGKAKKRQDGTPGFDYPDPGNPGWPFWRRDQAMHANRQAEALAAMDTPVNLRSETDWNAIERGLPVLGDTEIPKQWETEASLLKNHNERKAAIGYADGGAVAPVGLGGGAPDAMSLRQAALQGYAMGGE